MLSKLPADFNKDKTRECIKRLGGATPLNIFLGQEIDRLQNVISTVRKTLKDLKLAIAGTIIMSAVLQSAYDAVYMSRVPPSWTKVSWVASQIGNWFVELLGRHAQLLTWLENGRPKCLWLTGFFNCTGLLTSVRQTDARNHQWALDDVMLRTEVLTKEKDEIKEMPQDGIYIYGLSLEGAAWDKKQEKLVESQPKILFSSLPVLHVSAVQTSTFKRQGQYYNAPCYRTPTRTDRNYIFTVTLRTVEQKPEHWVLRGVALLCSID
jgi:dynein heavy chain